MRNAGWSLGSERYFVLAFNFFLTLVDEPQLADVVRDVYPV
jgi:hypothetical protein